MPRPPIVDLLLQRCHEHPDAVYLRFGERAVTWRQFAQCGFQAAHGLAGLGVAPGDRVAIMLPNRPEFLFAYLGIVSAGAAPVPINVAQRGAALAHILRDSGSVAVFMDESLIDAYESIAGQLEQPPRLVVLGSKRVRGAVSFDELVEGPSTPPEMPTGARAGLGILYTSGTTGPPKGVVAEGYDMSLIHQLLGMLGVAPGETIYTPLPLFHGNALILSAMGAVFNDWTLALAPRFSASRFWDDVRRYQAVEFNALGAMIPILLKQPEWSHDPENPIRTVLSAACPEWAWEEFERRFGVRILEFYGLVDYPGYLINDEGVPGSMGKALGATEFRVVDDGDCEVPIGEVGELVMRHPAGRLTHYHNNRDATERAYEGGWFHTGDLARIDEDHHFYYAGRKKESIRRRGENISAWEIESVVNGHPAVEECAAHAVSSELSEDDVKLVVVVRPGRSVTPAELIEFCTGQMAEYAIPGYVEFRDSLPKTGTHRIQYALLKAEGLTPATWRRPTTTTKTT